MKEIIYKAIMVRESTHKKVLQAKPYGMTLNEFIKSLLDLWSAKK